MKRLIYADNAATTKISDIVFEAMLPYLKDNFGNASSIYELGRRSKKAIEEAREKVASAIGANNGKIYFTSCGSESNNWAIKSIMHDAAKTGKKHMITTVFEHHAVLHVAQALEKQGFSVSYVKVDENGLVNPRDVEASIREDTALVSVMYVNNEIGVIQPISDIGAICRKKGVLFHTDAVQAIGNVHVDAEKQCVDLLSLSGHKINAMKGVGALYCRKGIKLDSFIHGGGQEYSKRAGTENVAGIVGLGTAVEYACSKIDEKIARLTPIRNMLIDEILKLPRTRLNGDRSKRVAGNVNISFEGVEGESLLLMLDMHGISASSGSACTSGSLDPSHVLLSIGLTHEVAHGSLRLSLSDDTTHEDAVYILSVIPQVIEHLRAMSPLWERLIKNNQ